MLYSFRQGVTPRLPSHYTVQQIRDTEVWRPDAEANLMLATLGSAFRKDSGALPLILQLGPEITETLLTLAEITAAVDQYVRGGTGAPDTLDVLLNNIDWASHRLLSQPSYLAQIKGKKKKKPGELLLWLSGPEAQPLALAGRLGVSSTACTRKEAGASRIVHISAPPYHSVPCDRGRQGMFVGEQSSSR